MNDAEMDPGLPLWYFSYAIHEHVNRTQEEIFDRGHGYIMTDDDRACEAKKYIDSIVEENGVSRELGNLALADYHKQFIWSGEGLEQ